MSLDLGIGNLWTSFKGFLGFSDNPKALDWMSEQNVDNLGTLQPIDSWSDYGGRELTDTGHTLDSDLINSIRQTQSRGFKVIDIDPNLLDKSEFFCVYGDDILSRLLGTDIQPTSLQQVDSISNGNSPRQYWRSIQFDEPGTYLKIEFMPARRAGLGNPSNATLNINPLSITPSDTNDQFNGDQYSYSPYIAGTRGILIDFENPTQAPHFTNDEIEFHTNFSSFILSLRQLSVPVRITIGYNSKVVAKNEKEKSLHLFGGEGLTRKSLIHPTAFCLTDKDVNVASYSGVNISTYYNSIKYDNLICNSYQGPAGSPDAEGYGVSVFYITGFSAFLYEILSGTPSFTELFDVELVHMKMSSLFVPTTVNKRLCGVTLQASWLTSSHIPTVHANAVITEPIRVSLRPNECLALRVIPVIATNDVAITSRLLKFQMNGYTFGSFSNATLSAGVPYNTNYRFTEHPFPQDLSTYSLPRN